MKRKKSRNIGKTDNHACPWVRLKQAAIKPGRDRNISYKTGENCRSTLTYFFLPFFASLAAGFSYFVVNVLSIVVRAPLAESANGPLGFSCKYFSSASLVPSAAMTLPSGVTCALPNRYIPY